MVDHETPLELLHRDQVVAELFVLDKVERQASHALLRTLVAQLEQVVDRPISRGTLPSSVRVAPLQDPADTIVHLAVLSNNKTWLFKFGPTVL